MSITAPVVFIVFRRPNTTQRVFEEIRKAQPEKLFIVADGPRSDRPGEKERCQAARAVVARDNIDWDCEVYRVYADENMGCKWRVSSGLDWVFDKVDRAIILEDDCVPDPSFFPFCTELLDYYEDDTHVMTISGNNFQSGPRTKFSYYFSRYMHCWGWATWSRAWKHYAPHLEHWKDVRRQGWLREIFPSSRSAQYWTKIFRRVNAGEVDSWAYIWQYHIWLQSGLNIIPERNLVKNIGFGENATHTSTKDKGRSAERIETLLQHPPFIIRHREADRYTQEEHYESAILERAIRKVRRVITS